MSRTPVRSSPSVVLLRQAVDYTRTSLASVHEDLLETATPCVDWTLHELIAHLDDSLLALTEAAELGVVAPPPLPGDDPHGSGGALLERTRSRACDLLATWGTRAADGRQPDDPVLIGGASLERDLMAGVGALEIAVHGWDVAWSTGLDHPIPDHLARDLFEVARDVVGARDRPGRFWPPREPDRATPESWLLAFLGR